MANSKMKEITQNIRIKLDNDYKQLAEGELKNFYKVIANTKKNQDELHDEVVKLTEEIVRLSENKKKETRKIKNNLNKIADELDKVKSLLDEDRNTIQKIAQIEEKVKALKDEGQKLDMFERREMRRENMQIFRPFKEADEKYNSSSRALFGVFNDNNRKKVTSDKVPEEEKKGLINSMKGQCTAYAKDITYLENKYSIVVKFLGDYVRIWLREEAGLAAQIRDDILEVERGINELLTSLDHPEGSQAPNSST
jgi:hypothetical protein